VFNPEFANLLIGEVCYTKNRELSIFGGFKELLLRLVFGEFAALIRKSSKQAHLKLYPLFAN